MKNPWVVFRRISQLFFLGLFVYLLWSTTYPLTGWIPPEWIFKFDPLVYFFVSASERVWLGGLLFSLLLIFLTFLAGRFFCGWICPLGTFQDGMAALSHRHKTFSERVNTLIRRMKWGLLGAIALSAALGLQIVWVFDPIVVMSRFISLNFIPAVTYGIDQLFITAIKTFNLYGPFYDFYRDQKASWLGIHPYTFSSSEVIFVFFLLLTLPAFWIPRLWCRGFCPLGAFYHLNAKPALLERKTGECIHCGACSKDCRMAAITDGVHYVKGECILCMDCLYSCPKDATRFLWPWERNRKPADPSNGEGLNRQQFLFVFVSAALMTAAQERNRFGRNQKGPLSGVIRPPASLKESHFLDRCIRCGNCMKVCPTNGLQPALLESGAEGIWTPRLVPEIGACEYDCHLCGDVCPTGAIPKLSREEKQKAKLGHAKIDKDRCLAWGHHEECLVCEEHCPVPEKAIKVENAVMNGRAVGRPVVDKKLCIGCGLCQHVCPVQPVRAIRVSPGNAART